MWNKLKIAVERWPIAWLIALVMACFPVLNWAGIALTLILVLRHGGIIGFLPVLTTGVTLFLMLHGTLGPQGFHLDFPLSTWIGIGIIFIPMWASAVVLRATNSLSLALQALFGINFLLMWFAIWQWGQMSPADWYNYLMSVIVAPELQTAMKASSQDAYFQLLSQALSFMWPALLWFVQALLLLLARWGQSRMYYPGGFQHDFHQVRIARVVAGIIVGGMLWATFAPTNVIAEQWSSLGTMVLFIAGLAWVHWYVAFKQASVVWLYGLYLVIFVGGGWILPLLSLVGVFDSGLDLRNRLKKGNSLNSP